MIEMTVAIPMFNSKHIAWLPLESICRQQGINFQWELIVVEEQNGQHFGEQAVLEYTPRIKRVGCRRTRYISLDKWLPLAQKWRIAGRKSDKNSICFVMHDSDDYSYPTRFANTMKFIRKGYDWVHCRNGLFYHIWMGKSLIYDGTKQLTGMFKALNTKYARRLPVSDRKRRVDAWMKESAEAIKGKPLKMAFDQTNGWKHGLLTDGLNTISKSRYKFYDGREMHRAFSANKSIKLNKTIPSDVMEKLRWMRKHKNEII